MTDSNDEGGRPPGRPAGRTYQGKSNGRSDPSRDRPPRSDGYRPKRFDANRERPGSAPLKRKPRPEPTAARPPVADAADAAPPAEDRIAKVIARAGVASRRDAEAMIAEGRVTVNGQILASPALNVGPGDAIKVDGEPLPLRERTRLWLFHKPRGLVTTARDPEGRQTIFEALPEDLPRVIAIGRLDINTEGLLLLTNDGGLAKVVAHPETGWTRRYRARARGEVTQADFDGLRNGVTIDGMEYGPVDATLDRVQGDNSWITLALREGKNREVKRILEHLGLQVNRLIRLSFGPFQLGDLEPGLVEEVRMRVLKDQLGEALAAEAGVDFESPVREPIAPFGSPKAAARAEGRTPRPRAALPERSGERGGFGARRSRDEGERPRRTEARGERPRSAGPDRPPREDKGFTPQPREPRRAVWREGAESGERPRASFQRREDPKADRAASGERRHERVGAIRNGEGRKVLVERVVRPAAADESRPARPRARGDANGRAGAPFERPAGRERPDRPPRSGPPGRSAQAGRHGGERSDGERPKRPFGERPVRSFGGERADAPARGGKFPGGKFPDGKFAGGKFAGGKPGGGKFGGGRPGGKPGGDPKGRGGR